ncbi:STAS domain-containing protein [Pedobacter immunditicola]|uniref:STAS domain-containing protein n=1 Tax=Pedobacter immunditicola TaxID=3133440 RepID=UPI00309AF044
MKFSIDKHEKYVVITLNEISFSNELTPKLKSEFILLTADGFCNIILDLSQVENCSDSQDLSSLLFADRLCKKANGLFVVTGLNKEIDKLVEISGLHQSLNIVSKLDEATDLIFMGEIEKELLGSFDQDS